MTTWENPTFLDRRICEPESWGGGGVGVGGHSGKERTTCELTEILGPFPCCRTHPQTLSKGFGN